MNAFPTIIASLACAISVIAEDKVPGEKDSAPKPPSAENQSNDPADIKITQQIRQAVVGNDALSTTAKNVKIVSSGGRVFLRGPVKTAQEKESIQKAAETAAGEGKVTNLIEVEPAR